MRKIDDETWEFEGFRIKIEEKEDQYNDLYTVIASAKNDEKELFATAIGFESKRNAEPGHVLNPLNFNYSQVEQNVLKFIKHEINEFLKE